MADDGNLSGEQTDQLTCFQEITQIESIDECKQILEAFSWNVESAIQNSFNERESLAAHHSLNSSQSSLNSLPATPPPTITRPTQNHTLPNINIHTQRTLSYYSPHNQPAIPTTLFQWGLFLVSFPFKLILSTITEIAHTLHSFFTQPAQILDYDPLANIAQFAITYNATHGTNHVDFYQGSYSQAVTEAKRQLKFLVVYLHQNENPDCITFANDTMTSPDLIQFLHSNVVFWACSIDLAEGQKVQTALRAKRCPFLGIIVYKHSRMTLVSKVEGPVSAAELMVQLAQLFSENEAELIVGRRDKEERNETQMIRRMQDVAYEESLKVDREKARLKKQGEEAKLKADRMEQARIEKEAQTENEIVNKRLALQSLLSSQSEPDGSHPDSIKILIKLPSGSRHQRIFNKTESVSNLYNFVFANDECPNNFEIAINFPKKVVECTELSEQSIEESGINQSMLLFVNDLDA